MSTPAFVSRINSHLNFNKLSLAIGSHSVVFDQTESMVAFKIRAETENGINYIKVIETNDGESIYKMEFGRIFGYEYKHIATAEHVLGTNLPCVLSAYTKLALSLRGPNPHDLNDALIAIQPNASKLFDSIILLNDEPEFYQPSIPDHFKSAIVHFAVRHAALHVKSLQKCQRINIAKVQESTVLSSYCSQNVTLPLEFENDYRDLFIVGVAALMEHIASQDEENTVPMEFAYLQDLYHGVRAIYAK